MNKTLFIKKLLLRAFIGLFIGIAIGQIISVAISLSLGGEDFSPCAPELVTSAGSENAAAALQSLLCGIMGMGFAAASVVWELDNINIAAHDYRFLGGQMLLCKPHGSNTVCNIIKRIISKANILVFEFVFYHIGFITYGYRYLPHAFFS